VSDIAIIGMSCLFPGAPDLATYWNNILSKVDAVSDPPAEWEAERYYDPDSKENDRIYCKRGGFLGDLPRFNPLKFGVMPNSVDGTEPDQFLALRVAHEALTDAGYSDGQPDRSRIEVVLGRGTYINRGFINAVQHAMMIDQTLRIIKELHPEHTDQELAELKRELKKSLPPFNAEVVPGLVPNMITGRIMNRLDFMGTNYIIDAACASSLIAIDHGLRDLAAGRCDVAIVGGVHASTPPPIMLVFCQLNALSRKANLRPFGKDPDGTLLGEGLGMLVLKRVEDAERDGDGIYAVIKGVGTASDGRALGLLTPRVDGEELALRRAYESAGISPNTIGLIEAHGTGTPVGDATEIETLTRVFGPKNGSQSCAVGSVKSMISHTMTAAGAAGVIKAALALHHKILPPTLCEEPNPDLELEKTPFYINTETRPWIHGPSEAPRRAGVNAFGFGGINAHVILEEYVGKGEAERPNLLQRWESELVLLQGESRQELLQRIQSLEQYVRKTKEVELKNIAYTLNTRQPQRPFRLAVVATAADDLIKKLAYAAKRLEDPNCRQIKEREGVYYFSEPLAPQGKVALLFPGEGSQYRNMLSDLCCRFPEVRQQFDLMDRAFLNHGSSYLPSQSVFPPPTAGNSETDEQKLWQMDIACGTVFIASQGILSLLNRLKVPADCVVGHSTGEYSALMAAGALRVENEDQLIRHIIDLNRIYQDMSTRNEIPQGLLLAVGGVEQRTIEAVIAESPDPIHIAMDNCPHQLVLCGSRPAMEWASSRLASEGAICTPLPFERAYHTALFEPVCAALKDFFAALPLTVPAVPIYSCTTAGPMPDDVEKIRELALGQWARPVRFRETIENLYAAGVRIFIEVGPKGNLTGFVDDVLKSQPHLAVASDSPRRAGTTQLHHMLGLLAAHHVPMELEPLYERRNPRRLTLDADRDLAAGREPGATMRIPTGLQPLRLDQHRGAVPPRQKSVPIPEKPPVAADPAPLTAATAHSRVPAGAVEPVAPMAPGANGTPKGGVLQAYFKTMDEFLTIQQSVLERYLGERGDKQAVAAVPSAESSAAPIIHPDPPAAAEPARLTPSGNGGAAASTTVQAPPSPPAPQKTLGEDEVRRIVLNLVAEKTGYPVEMIGVNLDMEAELGIDSIKQVEILGAARKALGIPSAEPVMEHLKGKKTLQEIIRYFADRSASTPRPAPQGTASLGTDPRPAPNFPFLGTIIIFEPGARLQAVRRIDPEEDLFLRHHTLGTEVSVTDPALTALSVMPLTMTMEMMAQAAAALAPGKRLIRMREIRASSWIAFDRPSVTLAITATRRPGHGEAEYEIQIRDQTDGADGTGALVAESVAVLADHWPTAPAAAELSLLAEQPSPSKSDAMFHGPAFDGVASIDRLGENGAAATLRVLPLDQLFRTIRNPVWVTDPVLLDAAGQVVGYWTEEYLNPGTYVFPFRLRELQIFGPLLPVGSTVESRARIRSEGEQHIQSDIELLGPDGRVHLRIVGWEDRRFVMPIEAYRVREQPMTNYLSREWTPFGAGEPGSDAPVCALRDPFPTDFMDEYGMIWRRAVAFLILSRREREFWRALKGPHRRQVEWLLGRCAAKDAVRRLVEARHGVWLCPADVEILPDADGRPVVTGSWTERTGGAPVVSISHSAGRAVAAAVFPGARLGLDIECLDHRQRDPGWRSVAFTESECALLAQFAEQPDEWAHRFWCAKEAVAKALGRGLMGRPKDFVVIEANAETGGVRLSVTGPSAVEIPQAAGRLFEVHTHLEGRWITALTHTTRSTA